MSLPSAGTAGVNDAKADGNKSESFWHTSGVALAVAQCREQNVALIIFIEPQEIVMKRSSPELYTSESLSEKYARRATVAMHKITFASPEVITAVNRVGALCIRLQEGLSKDYSDFESAFCVPKARPALYIIGRTGEAHVVKTGFVSPRELLSALHYGHSRIEGFESIAPAAVAPSGRTDGSFETQGSSSNLERGVDDHATGTLVRPERMDREDAWRRQYASSDARGQYSNDIADINTTEVEQETRTTQRSGEECVEGLQNVTSPTVSHDVNLAVRLVDGTTRRKSFQSSVSFSSVREWVCDESNVGPRNLILGTAFPRRYFVAADDSKSLTELQLAPSANLVARSAVELSHTPPNMNTDVISVVMRLLAFIQSCFRWVFERVLPGESRRGARQLHRRVASGSMAQMRRMNDIQGGVSYDNGNSTQFNGGENKDESKKNL